LQRFFKKGGVLQRHWLIGARNFGKSNKERYKESAIWTAMFDDDRSKCPFGGLKHGGKGITNRLIGQKKGRFPITSERHSTDFYVMLDMMRQRKQQRRATETAPTADTEVRGAKYRVAYFYPSTHPLGRSLEWKAKRCSASHA
jgi:hypothetical protein